MKYRKLRIAWSAFCGILCLLLIVLWARSYRQVNNVNVRLGNARILTFYSGLGSLAISVSGPGLWPPGGSSFQVVTQPAARIKKRVVEQGIVEPRLQLSQTATNTSLFMRYWIPLVAMGLLVGIVWIPWSSRFGLRTLLI